MPLHDLVHRPHLFSVLKSVHQATNAVKKLSHKTARVGNWEQLLESMSGKLLGGVHCDGRFTKVSVFFGLNGYFSSFIAEQLIYNHNREHELARMRLMENLEDMFDYVKSEKFQQEEKGRLGLEDFENRYR